MSITQENFLIPFMCYGSTIAVYSTPCTHPTIFLVCTFDTRTIENLFYMFCSVFNFFNNVDLIQACQLNFHLMKNVIVLVSKSELCNNNKQHKTIISSGNKNRIIPCRDRLAAMKAGLQSLYESLN